MVRTRHDFPDLSRTAAALEEYRATLQARQDALMRAATGAEFDAWSAGEVEADRRVKAAYAADTADRNNPETVMLHMQVVDIAEMADAWKARQG